MPAKSIMLMGTGSDVGKSLLVAGLCRAYVNRGLKVAPFKPQNMSNNAAVTDDLGEIGRAQALQARAARIRPMSILNPVLLKPEGDSRSQLVVRGQRRKSTTAREYWANRGELLPEVVAAFDELASGHDLVLVEGAGSASEVNLRHNDIANFGFARARGLPVVLVGDIERGGVIASLVGTFAVVDPTDAALFVATLVNKFRGDPALFADGLRTIAARTGVPCLGPVPWFEDAKKLPAEDSLGLVQMAGGRGDDKIVISVLRLPHIANFDDFDPLRGEPQVDLRFIEPGWPIPRETELIIIPGTKSTRADLKALRAEWWDTEIFAHWRAGRPVLGICGGYQMLGKVIADPMGLEGEAGETEGLGLLDVDTVLREEKQLSLVHGVHYATSAPITGYHMHLGQTAAEAGERPFATVDGQEEGATDKSGFVMGTYLHGLFASDAFRHAFLRKIRKDVTSDFSYEMDLEGALDRLAAHLEAHLDLDRLLAMARAPGAGA